MKVAITPAYGPASVLQIVEAPEPTLGQHDLLVRVHATAVTAGDRRLRAADFPGFTAFIGRLMFGITKPKQPIQGTLVAGRVVAVGSGVTRFAVGDDVFGGTGDGAYAEVIAVSEHGRLAKLPEGVDYETAVTAPYGAGTALYFLEALAQLQYGEKLLILGASGGVGRYAVQLGKHLGAEVTAVCSKPTHALVRRLGADHVIDHRTQDFTKNGERYDVIFDIAGASRFARSRPSLTPTGRYLTVYLSVHALMSVLWTRIFGGPTATFAIAAESHEQTEQLAKLLQHGVIYPTICERFSLDDLAEAHALADSGVHGEVIVVPVSEPAGERLRLASA